MKRSIGIISMIAMALTLGACSSGSTPPSSTTQATSTSEGEQKLSGELVVWGDDTRGDLVDALGKKFQEKYGVKVTYVLKSNDSLNQDYTKQVPSGQGPDIIVTAHDHLGGWVKDGVAGTIDISNKKDDFLPVAVQGVTYDGQTYGVPYAIENVALVRNNKLTQETPQTFDEMIEAGKKANTEYPFIIQSDATNGDPYHMYAFQTSFGAPVFKSTENGYSTELGMAGEEGHAFAQWLQDKGKEGLFDVNITGDKAKEAFLQGKSPFIITGPWNVPAFQKANMDFSVMPIPSAGGQPAAPFVGVQAFFPSPKTKNPVLVNKFLTDFVASEEGQKIAFEVGQRAPVWKESDKIVKDNPVVEGFTKAGAQGAPMPAIPAMGAVWEFWGSTEANIVQGKQDPITGWDTMIANVNKAIEASK